MPLEEEYVDKAGIRVIVGHYRGDTSPHVNFSKAELDKNRSVVKDKPTYFKFSSKGLNVATMKIDIFSPRSKKLNATNLTVIPSNVKK